MPFLLAEHGNDSKEGGVVRDAELAAEQRAVPGAELLGVHALSDDIDTLVGHAERIAHRPRDEVGCCDESPASAAVGDSPAGPHLAGERCVSGADDRYASHVEPGGEPSVLGASGVDHIGFFTTDQFGKLHESGEVDIRAKGDGPRLHSRGAGPSDDGRIVVAGQSHFVALLLQPYGFAQQTVFLATPAGTAFQHEDFQFFFAFLIGLHGAVANRDHSGMAKTMKHNIYFAELAPFRRLFSSGLPVLCYHKIGTKPPGAKVKGGYMSAALFTRQMMQLREEGYTSVSPRGPAGTGSTPREIVLTFDDGSLSVLENAVGPMADAGYRAINYLVSDLLGSVNQWDVAWGEVPDRLMDDAQIREWMAAGHEIGAHTRTHPRLSRLPPAQAREEIAGSKKSLEDRFGVSVRHFCYPYGDHSPTVRSMVEEAGFETAVTVEPGVWRPATDRFLIPRIAARPYSRNLRNFFKLLLGRPLLDTGRLGG